MNTFNVKQLATLIIKMKSWKGFERESSLLTSQRFDDLTTYDGKVEEELISAANFAAKQVLLKHIKSAEAKLKKDVIEG
tara:strand:+ start:4733 stop:4969 length:237 start_codon:yes stop_codon:yes gene_type:complete